MFGLSHLALKRTSSDIFLTVGVAPQRFTPSWILWCCRTWTQQNPTRNALNGGEADPDNGSSPASYV